MAPGKLHLRHYMYLNSDKEKSLRKRQLRSVPFMKKILRMSESVSSVSPSSTVTASIAIVDGQRSRKPLQLASDDLQTLLDESPHPSSRDLAESLNVDCSTVVCRLCKTGRIHKAGGCVRHKFPTKTWKTVKAPVLQ